MTIASHSEAQPENSQDIARLAQLEERGHHKAEVIGSNPIPRICFNLLTQNYYRRIYSWFHQGILACQLNKHEIDVHSDERPFALIHGHLINFTPLSAISGLGGVFFCPSSVPPSRAISTPGQDVRPCSDQSCSGDLNGGVL